MLRPQRHDLRDFIHLDGLWDFRADPQGQGQAQGWPSGFAAEAVVAVPGSINEQLAERGLRDYSGAVWLACRGTVPRHFGQRRLTFRFASADLKADVWLDGRYLGGNDLPFLPFEYDVTSSLRAGQSFLLVVRLDGRLDDQHPLPGVTAQHYLDEKRPRDEIYPAVRYDFFPFLGLHRSVALMASPLEGLTKVQITTDFDPATGVGQAVVKADGAAAAHLRVRLLDAHGQRVLSQDVGAARTLTLRLPDAQAWSCERPTLYTLQVELAKATDAECLDRYEARIGFRRFEVRGEQLCLNGQPVQLRGFGMHEDFPVIGKGSNDALRVKDFELLRWIGANSFRTSHYAYAEETLDEADRRGVLVISEVASVNLDFRRITEATLQRHCALVDRQMARDGHHACVVAWSLTNEPGYLQEAEYRQRCEPYFDQLFAHARQADPSRPITAANLGRHGIDDPMYADCDFICINRYFGWYEMPGQLDRVEKFLREELAELSRLYKRPILITEFGADAIAGMHSSADQLFTEEYQADFIELYWRIIETHPGCIGGHVWNFADFRTAQHFRRVQYNHKGVFTRVRDPKMAAWRLKELWTGQRRKLGT